MQCTNCKSEILATAKFCPECGNKIENLGKTCPNKECNRTGLPPEALFCPDCGVKLETKRKKAKTKITSFTSNSSGKSGLIGEHLIGLHENKSIEKNQNNTSNYSATQNVNYSQSIIKESNWDKFTYWLEYDVWWEIKHSYIFKTLVSLAVILLCIVLINFLIQLDVDFNAAFVLIPIGAIRLVIYIWQE